MELRQILARVDELKAQIDALRPIQPEQEQRILQKFRLDWNYHSNAIEGNSLTLGETRAFLLEGLTAKGKPFKDHLDIRGHNQLILFLEEFVRRKDVLTEAAIREMHKILLVEPYQVEARTPDGQATKKWVKLGEYKTEPNAVQTATGEWIYYARPEDTAPRMAELVAWYRQQVETRAEHPLLVATLFHHRFTHIHPFDDGNGRMARALMNVILMREGFPPAVLKTEKRAEYVAALRQADAGDTRVLVEFVGASLLRSEELVLRGACGEETFEPDDFDKEIALLKQELKAGQADVLLSEESQATVLTTTIEPFLEKLLGKLSKFDDLFSETRHSVDISRWDGAAASPSEIFKFRTWDQLRGLLHPTVERRLIHRMEVFLSWGAFKYGTPFDVGYFISLKCGERKFVFDTSRSKAKTEYAYGERIADSVLEGQIQGIAENFLKTIKEKTGRNLEGAV